MAKNNSINQTQEPKPDRWYNIALGSSFTDPNPSSKFCSLRYEFKPASVDKGQAGTLHKTKDSHVTVEYHNNQSGRPKVTFQGVSEDYKENDAVLIFDGSGFRLERLHRAVKRLRHVRLPGESAAAAASASGSSPVVDPLPVKGGPGRPKVSGPPVPVPVEQIDVRGTESLEAELKEEKNNESPIVPLKPPSASLDFKRYDSDENVDILDDDDDNDNQVDEMANVDSASGKGLHSVIDIDINKPHQADGDDEIADVDISDDEADRGPNAAEALKAQVNAEVGTEKSSSSSSSSGSESSGSENGSGSGSGSSSSDSESSGDSVISV